MFFTSIELSAQRIRDGKYVELPGAMIKLKPFKDMKLQSLPALQSATYKRQFSNGKEEFINAYNPMDLWRRDQHVATFKNDFALIQVAELNYPMLENLKMLNGKHITMDNYKQALDQLSFKWDKGMIEKWLETHVGRQIESSTSKFPKIYLRYKYLFFKLKSAPNHEYTFIMRTKSGRMVLFHTQIASTYKETDSENAVRSLMRSVSIGAKKGKTKTLSKDFQSSKTKKGSASEEFRETLEQVKKDIANQKDWWFAQTPNYILKSNLTRSNRTFAKNIQENIELLRKAYARLMPAQKEIREVSVITVFNTREEYLAYLPKGYEWTGGLWVPSRRELIVSPINSRSKKENQKVILETVYHEGFHQYAHYSQNYLQLPIWLNEGCACFFEDVKLSHSLKSIIVNENSSRIAYFEKLIKSKAVNLNTLLAYSQAEFYQVGHQAYASAWGLCYFLIKAGPLYKNKNYDKVIPELLKALKEGQSAVASTQTAFREINMSELETDFYTFWNSRTMRSKAKRNYLFKKLK